MMKVKIQKIINHVSGNNVNILSNDNVCPHVATMTFTNNEAFEKRFHCTNSPKLNTKANIFLQELSFKATFLRQQKNNKKTSLNLFFSRNKFLRSELTTLSI